MSKSSPWIFDVSEAEFEKKVLKKSHDVPVVVDFWAPWCGPCRSLAPLLERLIAKRAGAVLLAKVNTDEDQNLAQNYSVSGIPHVIGFRKGKPAVKFTGLLPEAQLVEFLDRLVPSAAEKGAEAALELEKTNPAEAERLYNLALDENPRQEDAILGLARLCIARNADEEAAELLKQIAFISDRAGEADQLRARLWLRGQVKDLPAEDALRARAKAEPKNAQVLCDFGCVLAANGKNPEALETLFEAGSLDRKLATGRVKETMVKLFFVIGQRSELADTYRDKLTKILY